MELRTTIEDTPFAILDIETTGFHPYYGDRICEIAVLRVRNGKEENSFQSLINPGRPMSPGASSVNGITDEMVIDAPTFGNVVNKILPLFKDACIVCHNAPFDLGFVSNQMRNLRLPQIDN